ncbi:MAG: hypothetical protein AAGA77_05150 [Bacteroidota bacterium]
MEIDHIFIFTNNGGIIADELVDIGLTEGSSRIHVGQGTTNRKFYFDNFFLEILWVHDEEELKSNPTKQMGLWQRADFVTNGFSPFGLCLVNTDETNELFTSSYKYQPEYFPEGMLIEIIKNDNQSDLPWTFQLPFKGPKNNNDEPKQHRLEINALTKTIFEYKQCTNQDFINHFQQEKTIQFKKSFKNWLTLIFDSKKQGIKKDFNKLNLTIEY